MGHQDRGEHHDSPSLPLSVASFQKEARKGLLRPSQWWLILHLFQAFPCGPQVGKCWCSYIVLGCVFNSTSLATENQGGTRKYSVVWSQHNARVVAMQIFSLKALALCRCPILSCCVCSVQAHQLKILKGCATGAKQASIILVGSN